MSYIREGPRGLSTSGEMICQMDGTEASDFLTVFILTMSVFVETFCFVFLDMKHLAVGLFMMVLGAGDKQAQEQQRIFTVEESFRTYLF